MVRRRAIGKGYSAFGSLSSADVPAPGSLSSLSAPPLRRASATTIASPKPVPGEAPARSKRRKACPAAERSLAEKT